MCQGVDKKNYNHCLCILVSLEPNFGGFLLLALSLLLNQCPLNVGRLAQIALVICHPQPWLLLYCTDHHLLHFSWLGVVFKRIFVHDAKVVIKWGVRSCLDMELQGSPILNRENWNVSESL